MPSFAPAWGTKRRRPAPLFVRAVLLLFLISSLAVLVVVYTHRLTMLATEDDTKDDIVQASGAKVSSIGENFVRQMADTKTAGDGPSGAIPAAAVILLSVPSSSTAQGGAARIVDSTALSHRRRLKAPLSPTRPNLYAEAQHALLPIPFMFPTLEGEVVVAAAASPSPSRTFIAQLERALACHRKGKQGTGVNHYYNSLLGECLPFPRRLTVSSSSEGKPSDGVSPEANRRFFEPAFTYAPPPDVTIVPMLESTHRLAASSSSLDAGDRGEHRLGGGSSASHAHTYVAAKFPSYHSRWLFDEWRLWEGELGCGKASESEPTGDGPTATRRVDGHVEKHQQRSSSSSPSSSSSSSSFVTRGYTRGAAQNGLDNDTPIAHVYQIDHFCINEVDGKLIGFNRSKDSQGPGGSEESNGVSNSGTKASSSSASSSVFRIDIPDGGSEFTPLLTGTRMRFFHSSNIDVVPLLIRTVAEWHSPAVNASSDHEDRQHQKQPWHNAEDDWRRVASDSIAAFYNDDSRGAANMSIAVPPPSIFFVDEPALFLQGDMVRMEENPGHQFYTRSTAAAFGKLLKTTSHILLQEMAAPHRASEGFADYGAEQRTYRQHLRRVMTAPLRAMAAAEGANGGRGGGAAAWNLIVRSAATDSARGDSHSLRIPHYLLPLDSSSDQQSAAMELISASAAVDSRRRKADAERKEAGAEDVVAHFNQSLRQLFGFPDGGDDGGGGGGTYSSLFTVPNELIEQLPLFAGTIRLHSLPPQRNSPFLSPQHMAVEEFMGRRQRRQVLFSQFGATLSSGENGCEAYRCSSDSSTGATKSSPPLGNPNSSTDPTGLSSFTIDGAGVARGVCSPSFLAAHRRCGRPYIAVPVALDMFTLVNKTSLVLAYLDDLLAGAPRRAVVDREGHRRVDSVTGHRLMRAAKNFFGSDAFVQRRQRHHEGSKKENDGDTIRSKTPSPPSSFEMVNYRFDTMNFSKSVWLSAVRMLHREVKALRGEILVAQQRRQSEIVARGNHKYSNGTAAQLRETGSTLSAPAMLRTHARILSDSLQLQQSAVASPADTKSSSSPDAKQQPFAHLMEWRALLIKYVASMGTAQTLHAVVTRERAVGDYFNHLFMGLLAAGEYRRNTAVSEAGGGTKQTPAQPHGSTANAAVESPRRLHFVCYRRAFYHHQIHKRTNVELPGRREAFQTRHYRGQFRALAPANRNSREVLEIAYRVMWQRYGMCTDDTLQQKQEDVWDDGSSRVVESGKEKDVDGGITRSGEGEGAGATRRKSANDEPADDTNRDAHPLFTLSSEKRRQLKDRFEDSRRSVELIVNEGLRELATMRRRRRQSQRGANHNSMAAEKDGQAVVLAPVAGDHHSFGGFRYFEPNAANAIGITSNKSTDDDDGHALIDSELALVQSLTHRIHAAQRAYDDVLMGYFTRRRSQGGGGRVVEKGWSLNSAGEMMRRPDRRHDDDEARKSKSGSSSKSQRPLRIFVPHRSSKRRIAVLFRAIFSRLATDGDGEDGLHSAMAKGDDTRSHRRILSDFIDFEFNEGLPPPAPTAPSMAVSSSPRLAQVGAVLSADLMIGLHGADLHAMGYLKPSAVAVEITFSDNVNHDCPRSSDERVNRIPTQRRSTTADNVSSSSSSGGNDSAANNNIHADDMFYFKQCRSVYTGFFAPMAYSRNIGYLRVRAHQLTTLADDSDSVKVVDDAPTAPFGGRRRIEPRGLESPQRSASAVNLGSIDTHHVQLFLPEYRQLFSVSVCSWIATNAVRLGREAPQKERQKDANSDDISNDHDHQNDYAFLVPWWCRGGSSAVVRSLLQRGVTAAESDVDFSAGADSQGQAGNGPPQHHHNLSLSPHSSIVRQSVQAAVSPSYYSTRGIPSGYGFVVPYCPPLHPDFTLLTPSVSPSSSSSSSAPASAIALDTTITLDTLQRLQSDCARNITSSTQSFADEFNKTNVRPIPLWTARRQLEAQRLRVEGLQTLLEAAIPSTLLLSPLQAQRLAMAMVEGVGRAKPSARLVDGDGNAAMNTQQRDYDSPLLEKKKDRGGSGTSAGGAPHEAAKRDRGAPTAGDQGIIAMCGEAPLNVTGAQHYRPPLRLEVNDIGAAPVINCLQAMVVALLDVAERTRRAQECDVAAAASVDSGPAQHLHHHRLSGDADNTSSYYSSGSSFISAPHFTSNKGFTLGVGRIPISCAMIGLFDAVFPLLPPPQQLEEGSPSQQNAAGGVADTEEEMLSEEKAETAVLPPRQGIKSTKTTTRVATTASTMNADSPTVPQRVALWIADQFMRVGGKHTVDGQFADLVGHSYAYGSDMGLFMPDEPHRPNQLNDGANTVNYFYS